MTTTTDPDPCKITRDDVEALRAIVDELGDPHETSGANALADSVRPLLAKLRAILPPPPLPPQNPADAADRLGRRMGV